MYLHFPESLVLGLHEPRDVLLLRGWLVMKATPLSLSW